MIIMIISSIIVIGEFLLSHRSIATVHYGDLHGMPSPTIPQGTSSIVTVAMML